MLEWNGTKAEDLYYKRGFLCAQGSELAFVRLNQRWKKADLPQGFVLAYDPLNKVSFVSKRGVWLCLCGSYCMDAESGHMNFQEIAENLLTELAVSEKCFYDYLDRLNGRFVCIFSAAGHIAFLNDASAARSVFYSVNKPVFASHYNLVQELAQSAEDPFYPKYAEWVQEKKAKSEGWPWIMPANRTPWADIRALPCTFSPALPG